jgi:hypothetical protein
MIRSIITAALAIGSLVGAMPAALAQGNLVPCAEENGYCRVPYPTRVLYGIPGRVVARDVDRRGIQCSNDIFGDPAPGSVKGCSYLARGGGVELQPRGPDRRLPVVVSPQRDELRERMLELRQACEEDDKRSCVRLGILIGENRARREAWRREHPDVFFYER